MKPLKEARVIGDVSIQYLADSSHSHEGGHRITVTGRNLLVLPDGRTTARNRSHVITAVLSAAQGHGADPIQTLVGALVLEGATNLELDGVPVFASERRLVASMRLDIVESESGVDVEVGIIGGAG
ncbi:MAG TPA: hypothetical protein VJA46_06840 [Acidimicrobiia bacterium]|nr:hypothetical protein [Acidimicrobiia bacterium]